MIDNIKKLLASDLVSNYKISKETGIRQSTLSDYARGVSKIENMRLEHAQKLNDYYIKLIKETYNMDIRTLEIAAIDFNDHPGPARIYYDKDDGKFSTSVYLNDVQMTQTSSTDNYIAIINKNERQSFKINNTRKEYIIEFVKLINDGYEVDQAEYHLAEKYDNLI